MAVSDVGVLPTPALALLARSRTMPAAVVSASHNPFGDNGIKFFSALGSKFPIETEQSIERQLDALLESPDHPPARPEGAAVGAITPDVRAADEYRQGVARALKGRRLDGLHIVLDCANGAASKVGPDIFRSLGVRVDAIFDRPNGVNINDGCGSTHPDALAKAVVDRGASLGIALDGDADRLVAVDHRGELADGDTLLALFAVDLAERGLLPGHSVVVTVMSNLGFRLAMEGRGIAVVETPVGDRAVLAALEAGGLHLGGEQSGHIVFSNLSTTGDGILTGLLLADLVVRSGVSLAVADRRADREGPSGVAQREGARAAPAGRSGRGLGGGEGGRGIARVNRPGAAAGERDRAGDQGDGGEPGPRGGRRRRRAHLCGRRAVAREAHRVARCPTGPR